MLQMMDIDKHTLRKIVTKAFDLEELELVCADIESDLKKNGIELEVNLDVVGGTKKENRVLKLIDYLDKQGYLNYFITAVRHRRKDIIDDTAIPINSDSGAKHFFSRGDLKTSDVAESEPPEKEKTENAIPTKKNTILFLSADSSNIARSRLTREKRNIEESFNKITKNRDSFEFLEATLERPGDLSQSVHNAEPQILHFAGHGKSTGELCFEDEDGKIHEVQPDALASLFELIANQVRCVILNACYSEIQAKVIAKHIDYVIGMSGEISDEAAITFAVGFYKALASGHSFEGAYPFGIVELKLFNIPEHLTPILLKKSEQKSEELGQTIPTLITPLSEFLERSVSEGPQGIPFTWLIGAGMSVTSGIPLAKDISYRIILFEYIMKKTRVRPWSPDDKKRITYDADLTDFFKWHETIDNENASFVNLRYDSINWMKNNEKYKNISLEDPKCYQWLFEKVYFSTTLHHVFLTNLVNRTKGVNLAHLGLAGLLRDHWEWGHTVFTTNFDDLLLKALLSLNHTARVFGDLQSKDTPPINPDYPQIVHLHGRHTGYRLRNTQEQISLNDPVVAGFITHIANSHLIVLGYSGWDELVINALKEWPEQHDLIKGNLIWIPYQNEDSLLPQVREFLNSCPPGRVHVITNEDHSLDADSFILSLCDVLNEDNGGFVPYRKGIIDHAKLQHDFVLQQLEYYPDFDPNRALRNIIAAKENLKIGAIKETERLKESAKKKVESDDIPDELRAKVFLEIGIVELLLGNTDNSELYLKKARPIWSTVKAFGGKYIVEKANTLRALGELYLKIGDIEQATGYIHGALNRYDKASENAGIGYAKKLLSDISMREGKIDKATILLEESLNAFNAAGDVYGKAICFRSMGDIFRINDKQILAIEQYEKADVLFEKINNKQGIATTLKGMAGGYIGQHKYEKAEETINNAMALYRDLGDKLGIANMENSLGDLYFQKDDIKNAIEQYKKSAICYRNEGAKHGLSNALADILACFSAYSDIDNIDDDDIQEIRNELIEMSELCKNAYASNIAEQFHHKVDVDDF